MSNLINRYRHSPFKVVVDFLVWTVITPYLIYDIGGYPLLVAYLWVFYVWQMFEIAKLQRQVKGETNE